MLLKDVHMTEEKFNEMVKSFRQILNMEDARKHYTIDDVKRIMDLARATLKKVYSE